MRIPALLFLLAACAQAAAADVVDGVPEQFLGEWSSAVADCGTGVDDLAIRIERYRIYFWESDGPIKSVVTHGQHEIALILELFGEEQTWLSTAQFTLSPSMDKLVSTSSSGEEVVRYRCPSDK